MPTWIEFHDSTLSGLETRRRISESSWTRKSIGGIWWATNGSALGGCNLFASLIANALGRLSVPLVPVGISNGHVKVGTITHETLVPLPFAASEMIALWIQLVNADEPLIIDGDSIQLEALSEARFVEKLPVDFCPF